MLVALRDLLLRYGGDRMADAIPDIPAWSLEDGQQVAISGPSGSGKSTLLNLIAGLLSPTRGSVTVCGQELPVLGETERDRFRAAGACHPGLPMGGSPQPRAHVVEHGGGEPMATAQRPGWRVPAAPGARQGATPMIRNAMDAGPLAVLTVRAVVALAAAPHEPGHRAASGAVVVTGRGRWPWLAGNPGKDPSPRCRGAVGRRRHVRAPATLGQR